MEADVYKKLLFILLFLSACGRPYVGHVDQAFRGKLDFFLSRAKEMGVKLPEERVMGLSITFDLINQNTKAGKTIAYCDYSGLFRSVVVDEIFWNKASDSSREVAILHELGHCLLDRDHDKKLDPDTGFPVSIMYPSLLSKNIYEANEYSREDYIRELFTNIPEELR